MNLQPLLTEYLLVNGSLPLACIGQLSMDRKPAVIQESDSFIEPPHFGFIFTAKEPSAKELQQLAGFVAEKLAVPQQEATQLVAEKNALQTASDSNEPIEWAPFGHLLKEETGTVIFQQEIRFSDYLPTIPLRRQEERPAIISAEEPAETLPVIEPAYEMPELPPQKDSWWIWAIVIFVVSTLLILFRYFG